MPAALIDDDTDTDELIDPTGKTGTDEIVDETDNGNGPTKAEREAEEAARQAALKQVAKAGAAEGDDDTTPPKMIPKGRFDEVNEERKRLLDELAEANKALAALATGKPAATQAPAPEPEPEFDLKKAMRERLQALATGDDDRALELDEQIQAHTLKVATENARKAYAEEQATLTAAQQAKALQTAADEMRTKYPQLDHKGEAADADAIDFVIARRDKLVAGGMPMHEALRQAAEVAAQRFGLTTVGGAAPTKGEPAADRLAAARARNAAAANAQPPELGGKGNRATETARKNVAEMTDEEFAALPEAEKKRLRGDV